MKISINDNTPIQGGLFKVKDFYPKPDNGFKGDVTVQDSVINALCEIKKYYKCGIKITSTGRSTKRNSESKEASPTSMHIADTGDGCRAIDFVFVYEGTAIRNMYVFVQYRKDVKDPKSFIRKKLAENNITEIIQYPSWNHIGDDKKKTTPYINEHGFVSKYSKPIPETDTDKYMDEELNKKLLEKPSSDWYPNPHHDASIKTVNSYLKNSLSFALYLADKPKEFLEYKGENGIRNLDSIWNNYTEDQKLKFSKEYVSATDEIKSWRTKQEESENTEFDYTDELNYSIQKRKVLSPTYDKDYDYEINLGTTLYVPKNKANTEVFAAIGKGIFLEQTDIKAFKNKEFAAIYNDPTYLKTENVSISNGSYDVNYFHLSCSVWVYIRALGQIYNITPFIMRLDTSVSSTGDFSFSLNDISSFDDIKKYGENWYNYFQKVEKGRYNLSFWQKNIQQNDIVWIRYEELEYEKRKEENQSLIIPESSIPGKIYDMIGLIDNNKESYQASSNISSISISGRDLNKMLIEDGSYFYPFALVNGGEDFFLNYDKKDKVFKRLFSQGNYLTLFTASLRSIKDSLGFVFNQLTNIGILPDNNTLFNTYKYSKNPLTGNNEDRESKRYDISDRDGSFLKEVEVNGIWKIIRLLVDTQLHNRRLNNGEISSPDGNLFGIIQKICDPNFVEFWGDTTGDLFTFMVRQPPFTLSAIQDYFDNDLVITIKGGDISSIDLGWETEFYTWYQINPYQGMFGGDNFIAASSMPIVYFEEYSNLFGIHKKVVSDNYISYEALNGEKNKENLDLFRKMVVQDLRFLIESTSILPFTRRGSIDLRVGDRRIKKGSWIYFEPTNEIFYVDAVSQSLSANGTSIDRSTTISVSRGMIKDYVLDGGKDVKFGTVDKKVNYFKIINLDAIQDKLNVKLIDDKTEPVNKTGIQLVNKDFFNFFSKRKQINGVTDFDIEDRMNSNNNLMDSINKEEGSIA